MRSRRHLVIFAKLPRLGRVKRRLAAGIGALAALRFYRATAERAIRDLGRDRRWTTYLALTPDRAAIGRPQWRVSGNRLAQGQGDLGRRMARPFRDLPPGPVVIVGSDIPALTPAHVADAFLRLAAADLVFGPARDGGYWLIGARRALPYGAFAGVRWSTAHALADTLASLPRGLSIATTGALDDVDEAEAYRRWLAGRYERRPVTPP